MPHYGALDAICPETQFRLSHQSATGQEKLALDAHNLHQRLVIQRKNLLRFSRRADTPFTNNRSERDIRMAKVKQKVSGCFRTVSFAHAYCRISSYLQTMAALGYNPLTATTIALHGNAVDCLNQDNE